MLRHLIPSMFRRRLVLLLSAFLVAMLGMSAQLAHLTIARGEQLRAEAEARLVQRRWTPSVRGRILDREGRALARARPSYEVAIDYGVLTGDWARERARQYAAALHRGAWSRLPEARRDALAARYEPAYRRRVESMWSRLAEATDASREAIEARRRELIERVEALHESVIRTRRREARREARAEGREITAERRRTIERRTSQPIREQRSAHTILPGVPDALAFRLERLAARESELNPAGRDTRDAIDTAPLLPGLTIKDATARHYPHETARVPIDPGTLPPPLRGSAPEHVTVEGTGTHLLGWMRDRVYAEDHRARAARLEVDPNFAERVRTEAGEDRGAYREGDRVGAAGLEAGAEHMLRGLRGLTVRRLDTGEADHTPAEPGRDIRTTLDAALQKRVHAAMDPELGLAQVQPWHGGVDESMPEGTPLDGAAVVLDVDTGDILSMVSTPSFTRAALREHPEAIYEDRTRTPWVNRALDKPYPPGSVVKALMLVGAHARNKLSLGERIACTGHLFEDQPEHYRCWIFKQNPGVTHSRIYGHDPDAVEALMGSCNIFFYTLGRRLDAAGVAEVCRDFGVGDAYRLGPPVPPGLDPDLAERIDSFPGGIGRAWNPGTLDRADATLIGIGQGPLAWTPLHAADAFATLARGGARLPPRLIDDGAPPVARRVLDLDPGAVGDALDGLRRVVNDPQGTAEHITYPDGTRAPIFNTPERVTIWGKTGTAEAPDLRVDPDGDGPKPPELVRRGDHAWFVLLAGRDEPEYAVAILLEYAGSGARAAGPVANQIVHALIEEGYLDQRP